MSAEKKVPATDAVSRLSGLIKHKKRRITRNPPPPPDMRKKPAQAPAAVLPLPATQLPDAVNTLRRFWPGLFDGERPRPVVVGIKDQLAGDIDARKLPLTLTQVAFALKALVRSEMYLEGIREGAFRYDASGRPVGMVTEEEALTAEVKRIYLRQKKAKAAHSAD
ncbi:ProQ/FINO family protein [Enterobacter sp. JBIWA005]|uniref:ProQ/FINO family protein n=2 Tax=Enterobacteriaceae TaxID=543 RepID=UPI001CBB0639|nr:ProQ/FINO family protein [Enterobacter sp. JBIWA005]UAN34193.1 conjugal transfer protein [Enterobacter sp. JBIWA005]